MQKGRIRLSPSERSRAARQPRGIQSGNLWCERWCASETCAFKFAWAPACCEPEILSVTRDRDKGMGTERPEEFIDFACLWRNFIFRINIFHNFWILQKNYDQQEIFSTEAKTCIWNFWNCRTIKIWNYKTGLWPNPWCIWNYKIHSNFVDEW